MEACSRILGNMVIKVFQETKLEHFLTTLWALWYDLNKCFHHMTNGVPDQVVRSVESLIGDFMAASEPRNERQPSIKSYY